MQDILSELINQLRAASHPSASNVAAPLAMLWPDGEREWETLVPLLREELPILTPCNYEPGTLTGPATCRSTTVSA